MTNKNDLGESVDFDIKNFIKKDFKYVVTQLEEAVILKWFMRSKLVCRSISFALSGYSKFLEKCLMITCNKTKKLPVVPWDIEFFLVNYKNKKKCIENIIFAHYIFTLNSVFILKNINPSNKIIHYKSYYSSGLETIMQGTFKIPKIEGSEIYKKIEGRTVHKLTCKDIYVNSTVKKICFSKDEYISCFPFIRIENEYTTPIVEKEFCYLNPFFKKRDMYKVVKVHGLNNGEELTSFTKKSKAEKYVKDFNSYGRV